MKNRFPIQYKPLLWFILIPIVATIQSCGGETDQATAKNVEKPQSQVIAIEGMIVSASKVNDKIFATGTLLPNEEVELRPEISGRVTGIYFEEGNKVKAGQLLVKMDDSELKAQFKKVKVQEKLAKSEEQRQQQLLDIDAVSQEEYDISLNQLNTLEAEMDLLETQIRKTSIYAPFSGIIGLRNVSKGGYITPSDIIASLLQIDPIKLEFSVPEVYSSKLKDGAKVDFAVSGIDKTFTASVYAVDSRIDINTRTVKARAKSANPGNIMSPGAFARVEVVLQTYENALLVPSEAILTELQGQKIFVAKNGKAQSQPIKTGVRTQSAVQVTEGLSAQDTVILTGLMSLQDGAAIELKEIKQPDLEMHVEQPNVAL